MLRENNDTLYICRLSRGPYFHVNLPLLTAQSSSQRVLNPRSRRREMYLLGDAVSCREHVLLVDERPPAELPVSVHQRRLVNHPISEDRGLDG